MYPPPVPRERKCLWEQLREEEEEEKGGAAENRTEIPRVDGLFSCPILRPSSLSAAILPFDSVIEHARIRVLRFKRRPASAFSSPSPCRFGKQMTRMGNIVVWSAAIFAAGIRWLINCFEAVRINSMVSVMAFFVIREVS